MNRNLDGTLLTTDDLRAIATADGIDVVKALRGIHNTAAVHSKLDDLTRVQRHAMFCAGQLRLDTRFDRPVVGP